ncbi:MAG: transporter, partial [Vicinamibacteria bacterium]
RAIRKPLPRPVRPFARRSRIALSLLAIGLIGPASGFAQVPPRFYLDGLSGSNAVPVIFQSISGNANPLDPAHVVSGDIDALVAIAGYAKTFPLFDRSAFLALLLPMGRISGETTVGVLTFDQSATGFGDPMLEFNINVIGPKAIRNIPDVVRYEPGFSLDLILDLAFPIGEYKDDQALNLGQNRWYGRVGAPLILQIGPWVPGRRTTLELLPSVWFFSDNDDYVGTTLKTDPMFQLEGHLTRDFMEDLWGSVDVAWLIGGKSEIDGDDGDSLNSVKVGFTLGYHINDNIQLTAGYSATVGEASGDLEMDTFLFSLVFGWHKAVEGMERLAK